jgi:mannose/fructose/N-acetylgalactosamine-specific phosphotransferase system component IIC
VDRRTPPATLFDHLVGAGEEGLPTRHSAHDRGDGNEDFCRRLVVGMLVAVATFDVTCGLIAFVVVAMVLAVPSWSLGSALSPEPRGGSILSSDFMTAQGACMSDGRSSHSSAVLRIAGLGVQEQKAVAWRA